MRGWVHGNNAYAGSTEADKAIVTPISLCQPYPDIALSSPGVLDYSGGDYSTVDQTSVSEYGFSSPTPTKIYSMPGIGANVASGGGGDSGVVYINGGRYRRSSYRFG